MERSHIVHSKVGSGERLAEPEASRETSAEEREESEEREPEKIVITIDDEPAE